VGIEFYADAVQNSACGLDDCHDGLLVKVKVYNEFTRAARNRGTDQSPAQVRMGGGGGKDGIARLTLGSLIFYRRSFRLAYGGHVPTLRGRMACAAPPGALEQLLFLKKSIYSTWAIVKRLRKKTRWFAVFSEDAAGDRRAARGLRLRGRKRLFSQDFSMGAPFSRQISLGSGAKMPAAANEGVPTPAPSVQAGGGAI
ncbi:MAG: hypothetical protein LBL45_05985, partial [Treponema sp.]|nr:hypothetical protein [Treponema sp.]